MQRRSAGYSGVDCVVGVYYYHHVGSVEIPLTNTTVEQAQARGRDHIINLSR